MTIAQLPFVFLFATKNSLLSVLWQKGYEKLNFLHRWAGRGVFLSASLHGGFWIRNHLQYNVPILGFEKERLGVITYSTLGVIVLTSLKPVRKFAYQVFFYLQYTNISYREMLGTHFPSQHRVRHSIFCAPQLPYTLFDSLDISTPGLLWDGPPLKAAQIPSQSRRVEGQ
jgi:hypothetical protein